jgi:hypothetical protein
MDRPITTTQPKRKEASTKEALRERLQVEQIDTMRYEFMLLEEVELYFSLRFV